MSPVGSLGSPAAMSISVCHRIRQMQATSVRRPDVHPWISAAPEPPAAGAVRPWSLARPSRVPPTGAFRPYGATVGWAGWEWPQLLASDHPVHHLLSGNQL